MSNAPKLTTTQWLIIVIASIGFLFDTYELLMTPLVAPPAIASFMGKLPFESDVLKEVGRLLWMTAVCGGVFGLLGGWLIDKFGRKTIMVASIFLYSAAPVCAAFSTSLAMFEFFRCATFVGVCVEFVAAVTWIAEMFEDKKQKERWLGITQAFASLGGVLVTAVASLIHDHLSSMPAFGFAGGAVAANEWRYVLLTGLFPAIPIALLLPFAPESKVWKDRAKSGDLRRPSFAGLFSPELRRVTIVTAILSACAYGIAFGALQVTVSTAATGRPDVVAKAKELTELRAKGKASAESMKAETDAAKKAALKAELDKNKADQLPLNAAVTAYRNRVQFNQEMGGLFGRVALAILLIIGIARTKLLRLLQGPAVILLPITYFVLYPQAGDGFLWAYAACAFFTVAQFSYFGEYLPKSFPLHLRGTGGSFATNVGGRMIGTSAALLTTNFIAPMFAKDPTKVLPIDVAKAAGWVGLSIAIVAFAVGFLLPEPKETVE